ARERERVRGAFELGDAGLERGSGRVGAAGVLVAAVVPYGVLHERRRQRDRRNDRARRRVGLLTGVDGARLERVVVTLPGSGILASLVHLLCGRATPKASLRARHPGERDARNDSTSERVRTTKGCPPSRTSTDGARTNRAP